MKAMFFALFVILLMVGCGEADLIDPETLEKITAEAIVADKLKQRGDKVERLAYAPNEPKPYTGWTKRMYDDGKLGDLKQYKDGKPDGAYYYYWQSNGRKWIEGNFKEGKKVGIWIFYNKDGTVSSRHTIRDGDRAEQLIRALITPPLTTPTP